METLNKTNKNGVESAVNMEFSRFKNIKENFGENLWANALGESFAESLFALSLSDDSFKQYASRMLERMKPFLKTISKDGSLSKDFVEGIMSSLKTRGIGTDK